jgi:hypothetical protein
VIDISKKYLPAEEAGRWGYKSCLGRGLDPISYADALAGRSKEGIEMKLFIKNTVCELLPPERHRFDQDFEQYRLEVLNGFRTGAIEAGDLVTSSYVSHLMGELQDKSKGKIN